MDLVVGLDSDARIIRRELLPDCTATGPHDYACLAFGGAVLLTLLTACAWTLTTSS